jgi:DNA excision repair protein ERCC-2
LYGLAQANQWRAAVLVDEAHNLVERGRKMFTAELHPVALAQARKSPTAAQHASVKKALDKVRRAWVALDKAQTRPYAVLDAFPEKLLGALQQCTTTLTEHFTEHPTEPDAALQAFYFDALHLQRLADLLDAHSMVDLTQPALRNPPRADRSADAHQHPKPGDSLVTVRNVVPAPFLQPRLQATHCSVLFSATLQPAPYYADLLGLPDHHVWVDVESPFSAQQLQVQVAQHISTRYARRAASLAPMAALMAQQFHARPGNYLAFFSSYEYLQQAAEAFARQHPDVPHWCQSRRMLEAEQHDFLARFTPASQGIAFAVLGGAFSEGIDLPGARLIGAFVATLGLPQINPVNEEIRQRMQALFGAGYDYTYLYPGLQKVVQAAGRVIRTPSDEGVVHLMDDRFGRSEVRRLLPTWWSGKPDGIAR